MAQLSPPGSPDAKTPPVGPPPDPIKEAAEDAQVVALKLGTSLIKWIPWPEAPEQQWVPIRTLSIPECDMAYLYAHGKCRDLKREGDDKLFDRFERLAILSHAIRNGLAIQTGIDATGQVILDIKYLDEDEPRFTSPDHVRTSLRDLEALNELIGYYWNHCREAAPLSTYRRLAMQGEFDALAKMLKKKPGPIDWEGFSEGQLVDLLTFLVRSYPVGDDSPA